MNNSKKWQQTLLRNIELQIFISFISLPFLIAWGLPLSIIAPVSTLIFSPILTIFLLISSIIFFLELFSLPNAIFIWILEKITSTWLFLLSFGQRSWLIAFKKPPIIIIIGITLAALCIMHSKKIKSQLYRMTSLALLFIISCIALKFFPYTHPAIQTINCNKGTITVINHNNTLTIVDPGYLSSQSSLDSWISYTFIPELLQRTGKMTIDTIIILKINKRIFDGLITLSKKITIKNIYIPWWEGKIPLFAWRSYKKLKHEVSLQGGKIQSISRKKQLINTDKSTLFLAPDTQKNIDYYGATYHPLFLSGTCEEHIIMLQSI